ncbi:hypothetical protein ACT7DN_12410 [Bacillus paranthracis]
MAEEQTAGRGRLSRKWHSPKRNRNLDEYYFTSINPGSTCTTTYFVSSLLALRKQLKSAQV